MAPWAARTELRLKFTAAVAPGGFRVHRVRSAAAFWRGGKIAGVYITWACGRVSPQVPNPVDGDLTCCGCLRAEGRHP